MLKSQRLSFHLAAASVVLAAISLIMFFVTNATVSYAVVDGPLPLSAPSLPFCSAGARFFCRRGVPASSRPQCCACSHWGC